MKLTKKLLGVTALAFAMSICAGVASLNVQADGEQALDGFAITEASVRIGNDTKANPSGLRFKTVVGENAATTYADAECYSTISFTSSVVTETNPNGDPVEYTANVPATSWRAEGDGWNTVLLEIPESDYGTEITVQSFIVTADATYATEKSTATIEYVASKVMQNGNDAEKLVEYTKNAVSAIELDKTSATLQVGETLQLTATTDPEGFGVVWASDNESVAKVDKNGKVSAVGAGSANITATMSGKTATCAVTATYANAYTFENNNAGPILKVANAAASDFEYKTVNGSTVLDASSGILRDEAGANNMDTFLFHLDHDYIDWAMANHDYLTFDFYATVPYIGYLRADRVNVPAGESGWAIYLYGSNTTGNVKHLKGEAVDGDLYKYSIVLNQEMYKAIQAKEQDYAFRFSLIGSTSVSNYLNDQVPTDVLYFDNVQAHDYTTDVIDFEDGVATELGFQWFGQQGTSVGIKERTAGNKALYVTGSGNNGVGVTAEYLNYVFNECNADYLEWKFYPDDTSTVTNTIPKAVRLLTQVNQYGIDNTWTWNATEGYMLCKLYKSSYNEAMAALNGAAPTKLALYTYVGAAGAYKAGGYIDDITPVIPQDCAAIDTTYLNTVNVSSVIETNESVTLTTSGSTWAIGFDIDFLMDAFYVQNATSVTIRLSARDYEITGFRFANGQTYGRVILWKNATSYTSLFTADDTSRWEIVDGDAILTLSAADFKAYFKADGTSTGADGGGVTLGWRLCAQANNGTTNINGTFTIFDITINK